MIKGLSCPVGLAVIFGHQVILGEEDLLGEGGLLSIDSTEGVVKLAATGDVKMFQLAFLCKMKADD